MGCSTMPFGIREAQMCALAKAAKHSDAVGLEKIQHSTDTIHPTVRKATSRSALRKHLRSSRPQNPAAWFSGASIPDVPLSNNNSLHQASLFRATKCYTKQFMPTPRGRRPPPTPGGLVYGLPCRLVNSAQDRLPYLPGQAPLIRRFGPRA